MIPSVSLVTPQDNAMEVDDCGGKKPKSGQTLEIGSTSVNYPNRNAGSMSNLEPPRGPLGAGGLTVPTPGGVFPLRNSPQVASSGSATGNPRNKVALKPGFSLMDWIRLTKSGKDLSGTGGKMLKVTRKELEKHKKKNDAWMALNGMVYNVSHYMDYHPGGWDELMKGAGKDATDIFNEVHRWVNYESMLQACLVGKLVDHEEHLPTFKSPNGVDIKKPVIPPIGSTKQNRPSFDYYQTETTYVISIYTRKKHCIRENVIAELGKNKRLHVLIQFPEDQTSYTLMYDLFDIARLPRSKVKVTTSSGKVELTLTKVDPGMWANLGQPVQGQNDVYCKQSELETNFRQWTIKEIVEVTHDVDRFVLEPPKDNEGFHFFIPIGHHIHIKKYIEDMEIVRSYTPTLCSLQPLLIDDGKINLIIKYYNDGAMTTRLKDKKIGETLLISDHVGNFDSERLHDLSQLVLIAAGTGFTPMAKLMQKFLAIKKTEEAKVTLLFFNKTLKDIIWKDELETLESKYSNFDYSHILSQEASPDYEGIRGRLSESIFKEHLPGKFGNRLAAICGPKPFTLKAYSLLTEFGYEEEEIHRFIG